MTLFLRGDYSGAEQAYRNALEFDSGHRLARLNRADALVELGRRPEAERLYREVLAALDAARFGLSPEDEMRKAQCLARLGRRLEAVKAAQRAVQRAPTTPHMHQEAALVYCLTGDHQLAVDSGRTALEKGVPPQWFAGPAFAPLRASPQLRPYFDEPPRKAG